ncbi:MAG TPA: sigma-70 family RNA polymerase sigma factor [Cyclobacteriaceae bacterium]|nr:sigma-70 family RNA polymerase sigma factor [Cyclobacteriaceae bacterium]
MFLRQKDSEKSDEDIIAEYKQTPEIKLVGVLFSRYSTMIYGVCLKYLKDRDDAKDAVMQIFEKLPKSIIDHEIQHFKSWLYATSRNHCLMTLRAAKSKYSEEFRETFMESSLELHLESESHTKEEDLQKLERCIEQLRDEQKGCVELFYLKSVCYKDISQQTGIDIGKVKSHIQNGKRNLKKCMEGE